MSDKHIELKIKKRPWYEWIVWVIWAFGLVFILQNAITSGAELEPRAATIFWVTFVVWAMAGAVVWFIRRDK